MGEVTLPTDWIDRVLVETQERIAKGEWPRRVYIAPEDADRVANRPEGTYGDGGFIGTVAGLPLLCTYRVREGFWMVTQ